MELFAIARRGTSTLIVKVDLIAAAQQKMEALFVSQRADFCKPDAEQIPYCASYAVQRDELFKLEPFADQLGLQQALSRPDAVPIWNPQVLPVEHFKAFFSGEPAADGNPAQVLIQSFTKSQILNNYKRVTIRASQPKYRFDIPDDAGISLGTQLAAILAGEKLLFRSFHQMQGIFDMKAYYNEATAEDLSRFLSGGIFHVEASDAFMAQADSVVRKYISLIKRGGVLDQQSVSSLRDCAQKIGYRLNITSQDGVDKIVMPSSKREIKQLLKFLNQDYFSAIITEDPMVTNSKRQIKL